MFWKIYLWLLALLFLVTNVPLVIQRGMAIYYWADMAVSLVSLTGLFLYAYKKRWGKPLFWRIWLVVYILWDCVNNFFILGIMEANKPMEYRLASGVFSIFLSLPIWIAVYLYGYKFLKNESEAK